LNYNDKFTLVILTNIVRGFDIAQPPGFDATITTRLKADGKN